MSIDYSMIPEHMRAGTKLYMEKGVPPGNFLEAVLENKLVDAIGRADFINISALKEWASFLYMEAPSPSWGSPEKVEAWIAHGGLNGLRRIEGD